MNKLIKDIAQASNIDVCGLGLEYEAYQETVTTFAQLVVKECIRAIEPSGYHRIRPQDYIGGEEGVELLDINILKLKKLFDLT